MTDAKPLTFPQSRRMKTPAEFDRCFKRKRSASDAWMVVHGVENGRDYPRLGLSVSRKVGGAVDRNRVKRLLREAFAGELERVPADHDVVLVARPEAKDLAEREGLEGVQRELGELVGRALSQEGRA